MFLLYLDNKADRKEIKDLSANAVETYINKFLKKSHDDLRRIIGHLRRFLRYCAEKGYMTSDYSGLFPSVPSFRGARLPRGIADSDIQRILNVVPQNNPTGARDYALILLMTAYGLRGKSVAELFLEDINWQRSTIRIRAQKGGKEVVLPLLEPVGEAIVKHLRYRVKNLFRNIFLMRNAPYRPITSVVISRVINEYMVKARVKKYGYGAYSLRHSWAIRALAHDSPIKSIADVLGHRSINTSFIYAKADLKMLKEISMAWPERR
jgi:site-specific recombinase XerD